MSMEISHNKAGDTGGPVNGKHVDGRKNGVRKSAARSRVTNARDVLPGIDNRTMIARRYYDIQSAIVTEQGSDQITETRLQLIRRFSAAAVMAEVMEAKLANGEEIDINEHALLSSTMVRIGARIGLNRIPKNVTNTLGAIRKQEREEERERLAREYDEATS